MLIPLSSLIIGTRQRTDFGVVALAELRESILARGLIHAVFVHEEDAKDAKDAKDAPTFRLIAGERRVRAIAQLAELGHSFTYGREQVPPGMIPVNVGERGDEITLLYLELEENEIRDDFSWQERDRALFNIHQKEKARNPAQTLLQTAATLAAQGGVEGVKTVSSLRTKISQASIIAPHLNDPVVANARSSNEAYALILGREAAALNAERLRRMQAKKPDKVLFEIICGDSHKLLPEIDAGRFHLILTDPPYGISAGSRGARARTVHHHNYEDTPEAAMAAIQTLLVQGWRVTKPVANLFIFSSIDHFTFFKSQCSAMGWKPFPTPLIWAKSEGEGLAPWGRNGPRRTYETIFYAEKGGRGLITSPLDIFHVRRVHRSERIYGAQKPLDLMMQLIECSTLPGESVLDPFLGSGATLAAAKRTNRIGVGIELDSATVDIATDFIFKGELDDLERPHE